MKLSKKVVKTATKVFKVVSSIASGLAAVKEVVVWLLPKTPAPMLKTLPPYKLPPGVEPYAGSDLGPPWLAILVPLAIGVVVYLVVHHLGKHIEGKVK